MHGLNVFVGELLYCDAQPRRRLSNDGLSPCRTLAAADGLCVGGCWTVQCLVL